MKARLTPAEVRTLYSQVSDEYNATPLATVDGWVHRSSEFDLLQMQALTKYLLPNGILLDIGTGRAIGPRFAQKLGARAITIDSPSASRSSAVKNASAAGIEGHLRDLGRETIPLESGIADCALFADVIEHLIHSPKPIIREIRRVLKPGAVCIATTPNAMRITVRAKVLMGFSNWANIDQYFDQDPRRPPSRVHD